MPILLVSFGISLDTSCAIDLWAYLGSQKKGYPVHKAPAATVGSGEEFDVRSFIPASR